MLFQFPIPPFDKSKTSNLELNSMKPIFVRWNSATRQHLNQFDLLFGESLQHGEKLLPEQPFDKAGYISRRYHARD